jgi:VanZ family protein
VSARRWAAPFLWAGCILVSTSIPGAHLPRVNVPGIDKVVHFTFYGLLGWLTVRALWGRGGGVREAIAVLAAISLFGALDEWHQQFIPGRSMDLFDWVADTSGALVGITLAAAARRREARP